MKPRIAALLALVAFAGGAAAFAALAWQQFPGGVLAAAALLLGLYLVWLGLLRSGSVRAVLWLLAGVALVATVALILMGGVQWVGLLGLGLILASVALAKQAFAARAVLTAAPPPRRPVVIWNPKSGGGKALTNNLAAEARRRGIEPIELRPGDDLVALVRTAVADGADGLMAAGGDGTQALVARIAAEHGLPFACIPSGTRNHFALDLGVDRNDVVGALDAFVGGGEKLVDLGEVNGRTFVNNVSLGVYAEAVQREEYRGAKIRTLLSTAQATFAGQARELRWRGPDGREERSAAVILVSNNPYRLGRVIGSGTRPRLDGGRLGVAVLGGGQQRRAVVDWSCEQFDVASDGEIALGVDGEALLVPSPVTFRIRPGVLRVRIAPQHPGASPAAAQPTGLRDATRRLLRIAAGADPMAL